MVEVDGRMAANNFEKIHGTADIGFDEGGGRCDASIDMGFGGEVDDGVDFMGGAELIDEEEVIDIPLHEAVAGVLFKTFEIVGTGGVGKGVEIEDAAVEIGGAEEVADKGRADKTGAAGNEEVMKGSGHRT